MKTIDIIFNDEGYSDEFVSDLTFWCKEHDIPTDKVITGMVEDNVDDIDYFVITVNQTLFSYLMWKEYDMSLRYGRDGWNRYIESTYNCETA
tara:strand:- start:615 stop:890 length:276 start_codon:yes stop_codon:yes gene_type:complete